MLVENRVVGAQIRAPQKYVVNPVENLNLSPINVPKMEPTCEESLEVPQKALKDTFDLGRKMSFFTYRFHVNALKGRILTILDASIINEKQHKALKDLIEAEFHEQLKRGREYLYSDLVEPSTMPDIDEYDEKSSRD